MEDITVGILLLNGIQYLMLLFFVIYILDLKWYLNWSKKQWILLIFFLFIPVNIVFLFIGPIVMLVYLTILAMVIYRETKVICHILHVFMAIILFVIGANISYILAFRLLQEIGTEQLVMIIFTAFLMLYTIIGAFFLQTNGEIFSRPLGI